MAGPTAPRGDGASAFGEYSAEYSQTRRVVRVVRRIAGWDGVEPPHRVDDLIAWMRAVARDDARFLPGPPALIHSPGPPRRGRG